MAKNKNQQNRISPETEQEAMAIAKATQTPGQTKEQTKLIAKGIEKGIAEYKKRQKAQKRELDKKKRKLEQQLKQPEQAFTEKSQNSEIVTTSIPKIINRFCYVLLVLCLLWIALHPH